MRETVPEGNARDPDTGFPLCALCERPIPPDAKQSLHHLVPKLRGGKGGPVVLVHQICHNEIHASASEAELARLYATPEALREHPRLAKFVAWVRKRPGAFHSKTPGARRGWKRK
ncbi:HNH endonuclease [Jannaschia sp. W003]|uniref:HNH endonuclease n=1 Tax=Jannaschia sp. W003 TaxID=2867012 RepID=UPI0021A74BE8|nr:HNH endonuclease [Jannaschia sp. W003]UWQ22136.1 HNH endonuclease [Jannaschia sp. W003]